MLFAPAGAWAAFSSFYVFGDSLSDNGTAVDLIGLDYPSPYSSIPAENINRVSNGPVAVEVLANQLGLPLNPSLFGTTFPAAGTNYAVAGARAGRTNLGDLVSQINAFNANHLGGAPSDALYALFIGGNDVLSLWNEANDASAAQTISDATLGIATALTDMINSGAQSILVPNVFDIGLTPEAASNRTLATQRTMEYNTALAATLAGVEASNGINLFEYDLFGFSQRLAADPATFGLSNIIDPCTSGLNVGLGGITTSFLGSCNATNINEYAFIDSIHPTATVHNILGNELLAVVPLPAAVWLFSPGLLGLIGISKRKRAG